MDKEGSMNIKIITCIVLASFSTTANAGLIFSDSFSGFTDGNLDGQGNWGSQNPFQIASGSVVVTSTAGVFARAQRFGAFRPEIGDEVIITLNDFSMTNSVGNNTEDFRIGIAASTETTGAQTPQVAASLIHDGSTSLTIGGATDTAYNLGDELTVSLALTRTGADAWSLTSSITNVTDSNAVFTGSAVPTNLDGNLGASDGLTLGEYLDTDTNHKALFGMRLIGANTGSTYNIGGVSLTLNSPAVVPEPSTCLMFLSGLALGALRRGRRQSSPSNKTIK